ncbi:hypothetical protein BDY21DRAFT_335578 [Lineolata rhizophorae]|uniref:CFEM domain-containing protein n=1 Tax=Lineolata rhizophorae TaxID=578093 RepID=A0A6A6P9E5_9PEZI|nr:hypothetical protein BDY21DRAFT_335578 [Lineolata rhizophorae]
MRTQLPIAVAAALLSSKAAAQWWFNGPDCASDCWDLWDDDDCDWSDNGPGGCLCGNSTAVDTVNSCIADSDCSDDDKSSIYQTIAQACVNLGTPVSATPEATYSVTSGGSSWPTATWTSAGGNWGPGGPHGPWHSSSDGDWDDWGMGTTRGPHMPWSTGGPGPFGPGGMHGGWGPWGSSGSWTSGPWTNWWGSTDSCPGSTWSGWTSGDWNSTAPWTTWSACTASTSSIEVTTTGADGAQSVSTSLSIQVAQATQDSTGEATGDATGDAASATDSDGAAPRATAMGVMGGAAAAAIGGLLIL